ncbi:hypothetical protein ACW0JT_16580 [Arthrobacter sp. SA17]
MQQRIDPTAAPSGSYAREGSEEQGSTDAQHRHHEGQLRGVGQPRNNAATQVVTPQRFTGARRLKEPGKVLNRVIRPDQRPRHGENDQDGQQPG